MGFSVSDNDQLSSGVRYLVKFVAQLRDLLAAEKSAKVADKHQHGRLVLPGAFKGQGFTLGG